MLSKWIVCGGGILGLACRAQTPAGNSEVDVATSPEPQPLTPSSKSIEPPNPSPTRQPTSPEAKRALSSQEQENLAAIPQMTPLVFDGQKITYSPAFYTDGRLLVTRSVHNSSERAGTWRIIQGARFDGRISQWPVTGWPGDEYWGFVDRDGKVVIPPVYYDAHPFSEGWAAVNAGPPKKPQWGMIDVDGNVTIPFRYEWLGVMSEGLIPFAEDGKFGYMDRNERVVIAPKFGATGAFRNGRAAVTRRSFRDKEGYLLHEDQKVLMIDRKGRIVGRKQLSDLLATPDLNAFADILEGPKPYKHPDSGKWGYRGADGQVVMEPQFAFGLPFNEGLAGIAVDLGIYTPCRFIDESGKTLFEVPFSTCWIAREGRALAWGRDPETLVYRWAVYDLKGNVVFDHIDGYVDAPPERPKVAPLLDHRTDAKSHK